MVPNHNSDDQVYSACESVNGKWNDDTSIMCAQGEQRDQGVSGLLEVMGFIYVDHVRRIARKEYFQHMVCPF